MIKLFIDFISFIYSVVPFLTMLMLWTFLAVKFSKSIKKHANIYYWVFGILSFSFAIPILVRLATGYSLPSVMTIPIIGDIASSLSNGSEFIHPVLVIIMFMGAFSPKIKMIGKLMSIRKELSIIVGFPVIAHLSKRLFSTFPNSWSYFANYSESIQSPRVASVIGSNITNSVLVLGIVMTTLFLMLWITSFDGVRRKMGGKTWKKVQWWSYPLYAMLFIHATGLQAGMIISSNAMAAQKAKTELVAQANANEDKQMVQAKGGEKAKITTAKNREQAKVTPKARSKRFSFSNIKVSRTSKSIIRIIIYVLVYGSYLFFRLRKRATDRARKSKR